MWALLVAALAGCTTRPPATVLREGPPMVDLYRGAQEETVSAGDDSYDEAPEAASCRWWLFSWPCEAPAQARGQEPPAAGALWTRTAAEELAFLFPRLPNPDVYIHVRAHLATASRVPVPGYTTAVPLYERVEYALPGEAGPETGNSARRTACGSGGADAEDVADGAERAEPEVAP